MHAGKYTIDGFSGISRKIQIDFTKVFKEGPQPVFFFSSFSPFHSPRPRLRTRVVLPVEEMLWDTYHIFDPYDDGGGRTGLHVIRTSSWKMWMRLNGDLPAPSCRGAVLKP